MSIAIASGTLNSSPTWRQFQLVCICVGAAIGVGCGIYAVETLLLRSERRFVENPADTMTRAVGLAHFSIGWMFLFTSPRLRNRSALSRLTFWTLFGVGFCALFAWGGADKNPLLLLAFYGFFFIHEACDEAFLFETSGELNTPPAGAERLALSLRVSVSLAFIVMLTSSQVLKGHVLARSGMILPLPGAWLAATLLVMIAAAAAALVHTLSTARSIHGSLRQAAATYQPLLAIYAVLFAVLIIGSLIGSIGISLVILLHGLTWLVCTYRRLGERNAEVTGPWSWVRNSPTGFLTLHLATMGVALLLFALRAHVWERSGFVCDLVSKTWFPYWGIMHIAMSFWRTK